MKTTTIELKRIGQIQDATIEFGDLTVLVGPQATGKSIFLQFLKLLLDPGFVLRELRRHGLAWKRDVGSFLDVYLGEGMRESWSTGDHGSKVIHDGESVDVGALIQPRNRSTKDSLFYIPAQRVLTLGRGWPRPFSDYGAGDPFAVRDFSEKLRLLMEGGFSRSAEGALFPQSRQLKDELREILVRSIFGHFALRVDVHGAQKRLVLRRDDGEATLPFMVWSAGQREFVPLLMGLYWLLPPAATKRRKGVAWVVIEEPEAGLHTEAISAVLLLLMDLLWRGYRVCLSTHSPHVLDVVWALTVLQQHEASPDKLLELFDARKSLPMQRMAASVLRKEFRVFYFDRDSGTTRNISRLDPGSNVPAEAGWGGLSEFSGRVAEVVAGVVPK